jgi:hypothetical protein
MEYARITNVSVKMDSMDQIALLGNAQTTAIMMESVEMVFVIAIMDSLEQIAVSNYVKMNARLMEVAIMVNANVPKPGLEMTVPSKFVQMNVVDMVLVSLVPILANVILDGERRIVVKQLAQMIVIASDIVVKEHAFVRMDTLDRLVNT